jgi:2-(1,2-epoxy-1,2-dihydrophenyl)acetyl-CoA isomerase
VSETKLTVSHEGDVLVIALDDPDKLNAISEQMADELTDALKRVRYGITPARAVVLAAEGRAFCSGADFSSGGALNRAPDVDGLPNGAYMLDRHYHPLVCQLRDLPVPIVCAVQGAAAGIGCSIALMCDLIVAGESAYFLQAFRRIGLGPDGGISWILPRIVGKARAMEMLMLGDRIAAPKALEWGLINRCVPDAELRAAALDLAQNLAGGPASLGTMRRTIWEGLENGWREQIEVERDNQLMASKSADYREGVTAFREKRPARFTGQ